jgi:hypothetical protein
VRVRLDTPTDPRALEAKAPSARLVEPKRTPLKPSEIRRAISQAYTKLHGKAISPKTLDILSAQVSNETALGSSMYNFNFGGIKGASPEGLTAKCGTREVLGGEEHHIVDGFRAYGSATQGATDYVSFLEKKYPKAVESAEKGDVDGFVAHLKAGHYFTADAAQYTANVKSLLSVDDSAVASRGNLSSGVIASSSAMQTDASPFATSATLSRVFDAMSVSAASIAMPSSDEDDAQRL